MKLFRPAHLRFEFRDTPDARLRQLLSAHDTQRGDWFASAAHLDEEVRIDAADLRLVAQVPAEGVDADQLERGDAGDGLERLLAMGVLLSDDPRHALHFHNDARIRAIGWWGPAALAHRLGRWREVDVAAIEAAEGRRDLARLLAEQGEPPTEAPQFGAADAGIALPSPERSALDQLLGARSTCRNFDQVATLPLAQLAALLHRVFGAQAVQALAPGASMLKKNSPSGGGLHPIEAFVLAQRVDSVPPGLYHYHCTRHALEPMRALAADELAADARELVAGQAWFADAPVFVLLVARFERSFWKYPNHAKAWRVIQLDAGHLSQNLYLAATEMGYGAFVTGAINEHCAERLGGFDPMQAGAIAVCGFGKRAAQATYFEFDPLGRAAG